MADFLLIYQGGDPSWREKRSEAEIEAAMQAWGQWFKQLESTGNLRNPGAPLAPGGVVLRTNGRGIQTDMAMAEVKELIGGYSIIAADSLEQAAELAKGTPFLRNNPNGCVHVRPIMQMG
ncbi:MAG TPA: YciI family protein [Vicinamibacterales bacterium]|nr:YciI family protein [Vicinamibacterales bacterium]